MLNPAILVRIYVQTKMVQTATQHILRRAVEIAQYAKKRSRWRKLEMKVV